MSKRGRMILAIDTATRNVSLALHDGHEVIAEMTWRTANHHTVELTPALSDMLRYSGVTPADLTALAVTLGPGSYTGLRIGMSLAKGIALAASPPLPLVGIPTLDVVAAAQPHEAERLVAVAQAGRRRINAGLYEWGEAGWQSTGEPFITTWEKLLDRLETTTQVAGEIDAAGAELLAAVPNRVIVASPAQNVRRAGYLAELALRRLQAGAPADAAAIAPVYLS
ncbi:MAG TPA: tRNA (adenosine(37)-N6)-threonylcarbamoyltransferase complex dimerization subunit type 1 TsaB [Aggregatilineales bacterium]|nr:tRNA (adenosine(37)-N6)-threonylcarbamoyltransferase complex dimerization subunit type 1 TsaB [Chloroflexota bacterium]HOA23114.1 tRNA (adenosine(37)-N6)-threonylcarbamoyltransferase complex dimerization subunit type 1 TsaB [Aggregatilineales bacterium]HPV06929.1 tRNA (adenosine(37)-N6)-threonylcarbamoyltransferase complex dimerization subunit type 1 TsaB [Aggregatilineales bacterium]HQA67347.1 tRNA (adenosine(37)-N6)-threonylcarbamoyltransferase complex dimerization subunit type 1 TsaB [Aggr